MADDEEEKRPSIVNELVLFRLAFREHLGFYMGDDYYNSDLAMVAAFIDPQALRREEVGNKPMVDAFKRKFCLPSETRVGNLPVVNAHRDADPGKKLTMLERRALEKIQNQGGPNKSAADMECEEYMNFVTDYQGTQCSTYLFLCNYCRCAILLSV